MLTPLIDKIARSHRLAVVGVGSELRGDDAAGMLVAELLAPHESPCFRAFAGGTTPENLTGELKRYAPTHLVIVDAADFGEAPGSVRLLAPEEAGGVSFSTHALPLHVFVEYLREHFPCEVVIVGIQPKTLDFGAAISPEVRRAAEEIARSIRSSLEV